MNHSIQFIHTFNVNVNPSCCLHFIGCHSAQGYGYSEWTVTADLNLRKIERKKPKEELVARSDPAAMTCMRGDISQSPTASSRVLQGNQQKSEGILVYQGTHTLSSPSLFLRLTLSLTSKARHDRDKKLRDTVQ
jgi:hypothetical protein